MKKKFPLIFLFFTSFLFADKPLTTHRVLQFENDYVKVWKTTIMPNQPLKMHRHDYNRVVIGLNGGKLTKIEKAGEFSELIFETNKAYWFEKDPQNTLHADINESNDPIEVMVIELKESNSK